MHHVTFAPLFDRNTQGLVLYGLAQYTQAIVVFEQALDIFSRLYGDDAGGVVSASEGPNGPDPGTHIAIRRTRENLERARVKEATVGNADSKDCRVM